MRQFMRPAGIRAGFALFCGFGLAASPALADGDFFDIGISIVGGTLVTVDASDEDGGELFGPSRVFAAEIPVRQNFIDEPGFFALPGTFAQGTNFGFNILSSLRQWNDGLGVFEETDITMVFTGGAFGLPGEIFAPASGDGFVPGFSLAVGASGGFDTHPIFNLFDTANPGDLVGDGVWLINLNVFADGFNDSLPFSIVFNSGGEGFDDQFDRAIDFAGEIIPAPGSAALLAFGGVAAIRRRRR